MFFKTASSEARQTDLPTAIAIRYGRNFAGASGKLVFSAQGTRRCVNQVAE
jgi:hypothetical protein